MKEDEEWVADRLREIAAGARRHYDPERPRIRSRHSALRKIETPRAVLDVLCRRSVVARVLRTRDNTGLEVAFDVISPSPSAGRRQAGQKDHDDRRDDDRRDDDDGFALVIVPIADTDIVVGCHCRARVHLLDPVALKREALIPDTRRPREVACGVVLRQP